MNTTSNSPSIPDSPVSDLWKRRAQEQWTSDPCGANVARYLEFGSREYFDAIESYRYGEYAPWMKDSIGFDRYSGKRVLEIGCGTATDLLQFARGGARVTGIDLTPRSIEIARRRFETYGLSADLAIGDGELLSFPSESFDLVYSFGVLHHTPNTALAISEVHRVLKPGGEAIVMLYHRGSLYYWLGLMLRRGILGGELLYSSEEEIMSRYVEYSTAGGRPLVKAYTTEEAEELFRQFSDCRCEVRQLTRGELRPLAPLIPESLFRWLATHFGWNLIIRAIR